jgi:MSHA biogenesis protein MshN
MKSDTIVKGLIASSILFCSFSAGAWTVSEPVVDSLVEKKLDIKETGRALALPSPHKTEQFEKRETPLTIDEETFGDYRKALDYRDNGDVIQAENLLKGVLMQMPTHHAARAELATLYLKRHQLDETEMLLSEGLRLDENNPDFLRLMAVICDRREEPDKALALLVKVKDSRKQDKNYVAFLGHIYQQTGRFALARQQYYRLLQEEPDNQLWLLGVSIALDSEGQKEAALEGYRKITAEGKMEPQVLQYVQDRIKGLKG